ncbi:RING finger protein 145-like [Oreochromis niloticus]|uniref:RING finger protein 145-like n=1 Tax=Oreochromis niloticus TaxID=8128 RepID=UPI000905082F|nr:RING finger protein 145-like [Oreochromis niloticus]
MAYMICQFFHMDFWLLIIISSSILTSLQVAVCVMCYGVSETVFGEWSVMGSTIILVHSYYNVWLRAQLGWQSFLLRRDAVHKIKSLPTASNTQLEQYNDICAICFQDMTSAVFTPCSHFFHAGCLMPSLSFTTKSQSPTNRGATRGTPAANQNPAGQEEGTLLDDRKEGASVKQEGDNETATSAGETSSSTSPTGMSATLPSSNLHYHLPLVLLLLLQLILCCTSPLQITLLHLLSLPLTHQTHPTLLHLSAILSPPFTNQLHRY